MRVRETNGKVFAMTQQSLLDSVEPSTIDGAFWKFHRENPEVFRQLVDLTKQAKTRGRAKIGMKMLFEVVRWNRILHTRGDVYKLNNNFTSRYVRIIEDEYPEFAGMFEKRSIKS